MSYIAYLSLLLFLSLNNHVLLLLFKVIGVLHVLNDTPAIISSRLTHFYVLSREINTLNLECFFFLFFVIP